MIARLRGSTRRAPLLLPLLVACLAACASARHATAPADPTLLASFDYAWRRVAEVYPYPDMGGLDWEALRERYRPRAEAARTRAEVREVIADLLAELGESHFAIIPAETWSLLGPEGGPGGEGLADPGLDVRLVQGDIVVSRVRDDGPAARAGIRPGWILREVGGTAAHELIVRASAIEGPLGRAPGLAVRIAVLRRFRGPPGSRLVLVLEDAQGSVRRVELRREERPGRVVRLGHLPPEVVEVQGGALPEGPVCAIRFNAFMPAVSAPIASLVRACVEQGAVGAVVDLRGNPGGVALLAAGLAGHFVAEPGRSLATMITRDARLELRIVPRPAGARLDGPLAVLVDGCSASTSEIFAGGLRELGRATVVGEPTPGLALPSTIERLPDGDAIQFVTADLVGPDGRRFEGRGVTPDLLVPMDRLDLLAGRDAALEAALRALRLAAGQEDKEVEQR